jgi:hypothetical protein
MSNMVWGLQKNMKRPPIIQWGRASFFIFRALKVGYNGQPSTLVP